MAVVTCPECGKKVSSNARQCIHCGSPFTVCPDCNAALAGAPEICPVCGRLLKKAESHPEGVASEEEKQLRQNYDEIYEKGRHTAKVMKIADGILAVLTFLFVVSLVVVHIVWRRDMDSGKSSVLAARLLSFPKDCELMKSLLALTCSFCAVMIIYDLTSKIVFQEIYVGKLKKLSSDKNLLMPLVRGKCRAKSGEPIKDKRAIQKAYGLLSDVDKVSMNACYEIFFPSKRKYEIVGMVLLSLWAVLSTILAGIAFYKLLIMDFASATFAGDFYRIDVGWAIGFLACVVSYAIVNYLVRRSIGKKKWVIKNLA